MPVDNAGPSFVASCRCGWRSVHHLRRDAQQALGRHGETCVGERPGIAALVERSSFGTPEAKALRASVPDDVARRAVERAREIARERRVAAPRSDAEPLEAESLHHDHDDQREAGR